MEVENTLELSNEDDPNFNSDQAGIIARKCPVCKNLTTKRAIEGI